MPFIALLIPNPLIAWLLLTAAAHGIGCTKLDPNAPDCRAFDSAETESR